MPNFVKKAPRPVCRYSACAISAARCIDSIVKHDISRLQHQQFEADHLPELVLSPQQASQLLTRNKVDYLPITEIRGRVAATLMLVYPPGIALVVPGERVGRQSSPMIDYMLAFEALENEFPGLSTEIQGVYREKTPDGGVRFYTYVISEHDET